LITANIFSGEAKDIALNMRMRTLTVSNHIFFLVHRRAASFLATLQSAAKA
jgi:hypothetical protein